MHHFFAMMSRMKYIERWALMRNSIPENISEHSLEVSMLAHALAVIGNRRFGKSLNAEKAALIGLYHDSTEILTGDMPTPVKYYNPAIREAYRQVEESACTKLLEMLPEDLRDEYSSLLLSEDESLEWRIVKAADKISALIKCIEELSQGNREFASARKATEQSIRGMGLPAAEEFLEKYIPAYELPLDDQ